MHKHDIGNEMVDVSVLEDYKVYYPAIPVYKRVIDFVKSWFYYTKLKRYALESGGLMKAYISNTNRIQYAWWHCRKGIYNGWWGK